MDTLLRRSDGPALFVRRYTPKGAARAAVLMTPGFNDHVERHDEVCRILCSAGYLVVCWDLRGQGRSEGRRSYVERFDHFVEDTLFVATELDRDDSWAAAGPPVLMGHSTGALINVLTALAAPQRFRALVLISPFLGLKIAAPRWRMLLASALTGVWPTLLQPTGIDPRTLTHDAERARAADTDPLTNKQISLRLFTEMQGALEQALKRAPELRLPIYCRAAGDDELVDLECTRLFMQRIKSKDATFEVVPDRYHELHQETDRADHARALARHLDRWCNETAQTGADATSS